MVHLPALYDVKQFGKDEFIIKYFSFKCQLVIFRLSLSNPQFMVVNMILLMSKAEAGVVAWEPQMAMEPEDEESVSIWN